MAMRREASARSKGDDAEEGCRRSVGARHVPAGQSCSPTCPFQGHSQFIGTDSCSCGPILGGNGGIPDDAKHLLVTAAHDGTSAGGSGGRGRILGDFYAGSGEATTRFAVMEQ